ncbi:unnamed protein product [Hyaloperonospora brassicae]|uniref:Endonuclease III homolog n=1 Tax=Hyaloperonospora brassicae TaxID=162125 RepID=A0AAV0TSF4_HYABA|nr:unnamed protein product [Hyaloperonospora brassicae]
MTARGTSERSCNPFVRFALASGREDNSVNTDVKREFGVHEFEHTFKHPKECVTSRSVGGVQSDVKPETVTTRQPLEVQSARPKRDVREPTARLALLLKLYEARKDMADTSVDTFGTHVCVAPGVSSAKVERFQLLVAALLSSQTQDSITYAAMQRLHRLGASEEGFTIETLQATSEDELRAVLKPVGFYRRKARQLKQVADTLRTHYHGDIPRALEQLLELPGIGSKIGRLVALLAWGHVDGIVVDTHVHRVAQRLGWASTSTPEDTRRALEEWVPREHWGSLSLAVVGFGQAVCTAARPSCSTCPLAPTCPSASTIESPDTNRSTNKHAGKKRRTRDSTKSDA